MKIVSCVISILWSFCAFRNRFSVQNFFDAPTNSNSQCLLNSYTKNQILFEIYPLRRKSEQRGKSKIRWEMSWTGHSNVKKRKRENEKNRKNGICLQYRSRNGTSDIGLEMSEFGVRWVIICVTSRLLWFCNCVTETMVFLVFFLAHQSLLSSKWRDLSKTQPNSTYSRNTFKTVRSLSFQTILTMFTVIHKVSTKIECFMCTRTKRASHIAVHSWETWKLYFGWRRTFLAFSSEK